MTRRFLFAWLATATVGAAACHRAPPPAPQEAPPPTASAAVPSTPPGVGMDGVTKPVWQVLSDEKAHRPTGTPAAEAIFDALDKAGIATEDRSQVLGRMVGAAFCENAHTRQGIVLSACEFTDGAALARGRGYSEKAFAKALPNRALLVNKNTLLTINPPDAAPATKAQVDAIGRAFLAL